MGKLDDKIAVVTGSGRGIGKAITKLLASEGASVCINDINEDVASVVAKEIEESGGNAISCTANVAEREDAQKLMDTVFERYGKLDILVNNAGLTRDNVIHKMTDEQWDLCVDICLKGTFNCIRAAAKYMRKEGHNGRIINISSMSAVKGNPGQINYSAAKGGIISLTKTVAKEWEKFGITCNAIAYGPVDTRLTKVKDEQDETIYGEKLGIPQRARDHLMEIYHGQIISPEDAAQPVLFFALPETWFINGNLLQASLGGFS